MKHLPYKSHKNSGIEWIGNIPDSWEMKKLKFTANIFASNVDKKTIDGQSLVGLCNYTDVYYNEMIKSGMEFMAASATDEQIEKFLLKKNDVIITKDSETPDDIGIASYVPEDIPGVICGYHLSMIRPKRNNSGIFIKRLFDSHYIKSKLETLANGVTRYGLGSYAIDNLYIPLPSYEEQQVIANFLDRETAKIDELIQKQEKLIELIQEKITSVTDGFVTKGVDKSVPLKKTKFQTLGKVPSHWDVLQIKKIVSTPVTDGPHETPDFLDQGVPFVSAEAVSKGFIDFEKIRGFISPEANQIYSRKYSPQIHDIYMIKSGATTGITAIVEDRTDFNIWSPLAVIRCSKRMNPYYVLYAMRSKYFQEMVSLSWSFGTQQNIGMGIIENLCLPVPPKEEQDAIVLKINSVLRGLKQLKDKAISAITLLKEHRASLISAAVTGKIDVRGLG